MTEVNPTGPQGETLRHICDFIAKNGYSPTVVELAAMAEVTGNAIQERINALVKKRLITRTPRISRSIRPA